MVGRENLSALTTAYDQAVMFKRRQIFNAKAEAGDKCSRPRTNLWRRGRIFKADDIDTFNITQYE